MKLHSFWILRITGVYAALVLLGAASVAFNRSNAQTRGTNIGAERQQESADPHQADFDYLLGDWEFSAENRQYGEIHGVWSAVRLEPGKQIMDEYRIVGKQGETYYVTTTLRAYNSTLNQWELVSMDQGTGLQNIGSGHRVGQEMLVEQKFVAQDATTSIFRIRYYDIRSGGFSWAADRSTDNGKTWMKDYQRLEAHRIGKARTLSSLTPSKPIEH